MFIVKNLNIFHHLLGNEIKAISTSCGKCCRNSITTHKMDVALHFKSFNLLFYCDYIEGFFENEAGDAFYDFFIKKTKHFPEVEYQLKLSSFRIEKIEILSRKLNRKEFEKYPVIMNKIKDFNRVDDLFLFYANNDRRILLTFHPFMTGIEVLLNDKDISNFLIEFDELYVLQHQIK